jgi:ATP-binding protein involved in chromosome partitioning
VADAELADRIRTALGRVIDPEIRKPITELDMVGSIDVDDQGAADITIKLTIVGCPAATSIERDVHEAAASTPGVTRVAVDVQVMSTAERQALTDRLRGGRGARGVPFGPDSLTRVYAVTSGKGGVGKSTVTANLAVALAARGLRVGLVDADVHGFSIPGLLGLVENGVAVKPTQVGDMILPPVAHGVKVVSIGMFIDAPTDGTTAVAVAWRGPMLHRTIQQFLTDVFFGDLDRAAAPARRGARRHDAATRRRRGRGAQRGGGATDRPTRVRRHREHGRTSTARRQHPAVVRHRWRRGARDAALRRSDRTGTAARLRPAERHAPAGR